MENDQIPDPYEAVLADLRAQRERIESTIVLLESLRASGVAAPGSTLPGAGSGQPKPKGGNRPEGGPGAFLGMTIHDAAKKLLARERRQMQTAEIVREIERGGVVITAADKVNNVGSILLRRFYNVGDIVRVSRGLWGLQEWYPGRKFTRQRTGDDGAKGEEQDENGEGNSEATESGVATASPAKWVVTVIDPNTGEPVQ